MRTSKSPNCYGKQVRYHKVSITGNTIISFSSVSKQVKKRKNEYLGLPIVKNDQLNNQQSYQNQIDKKKQQKLPVFNNNLANTLLKIYSDGKSKNTFYSKNLIGIGIKKLESLDKQKQQQQQFIKTYRQGKINFFNENLDNQQLKNKIKFIKDNANLIKEIKNKTLNSKSNSLQQYVQKNQIQDYCNQNSNTKTTAMAIFNKTKQKQIKLFKQNQNVKGKTLYLYQKLASMQLQNNRQQINFIYQKRIKSYIQFLWKINYSHSIYADLTLSSQQNSNISKNKRKIFVGFGNNAGLIKGLFKRRYWWIISQDRDDTSIDFFWTQIKTQKVFKKQLILMQKTNNFAKKQYSYETLSPAKQTFKLQTFPFNISLPQNQFQSNLKIMNKQDYKIFKSYKQKYESQNLKQRTFQFRKQKIFKNFKETDNSFCLMQNHLQNNFYLGNKKALFYSLKQYYSLTGQNVFDYIPLTFHIKKGTKDPIYKQFCNYFQKRKKQNDKILKQDAESKKKIRNIWIVKPGQNTNQGNGIKVIDQIYELNNIFKNNESRYSSPNKKKLKNQQQCQQQNQRTYIVQLYLDRPFLYNNRKFDIRHYMLITNLYGQIKAYWYQQGYIRTSGYEYNVYDFQPQIHLTNDSIQKKYQNYGKYQQCNKISYEQFQRYLDTNINCKKKQNERKYNFKQAILPQMKKITLDAVKSSYLTISPNNQMHNFQIFGLDFIIDSKFKPWLIQVNTNPSLTTNCLLLKRIIPYMVQQSIKLSVDVIHPPPDHYPNTCKHFAPLINLDNFKYQLIFDSSIDGKQITDLYTNKRIKHQNLLNEIGEITEDEIFRDKQDLKSQQVKLQQFF